MESTRSEELMKSRNYRYSKLGRKNYNRRSVKEDSAYSKSILTLKLLLCVGIFTAALLIRVVDVSFTNDIRQKIKSSMATNISISEIYKNSTDKIKSMFIKEDAGEQLQEESSETEKKLEETTKKLVPTLE